MSSPLTVQHIRCMFNLPKVHIFARKTGHFKGPFHETEIALKLFPSSFFEMPIKQEMGYKTCDQATAINKTGR